MNNKKLSKNAKSVAAPNRTAAVTDVNFPLDTDEVARRAYFVYENAGCPQGRDVQHWLDAEAELIRERNLTRTHGFHHKN